MEKDPFIVNQKSNDIESAGQGQSGQSTVGRLVWKMSRVLLRVFSRRALALAVFVVLVVTLTYNSDTEIPLHGAKCLSNRTNPHGIKAPYAQDPKFLSGLWDELHGIFDSHVPSPAHLDQPKHEGFPNQDNLAGFFNLTDDEASNTRETHKKLLAKLPTYPAGRFKGRGVVVLAGGRYSEFAATSVGMLREVGSQLPVEIWTKDHSEEYDEWCSEIKREGMTCRRLADYMDMGSLKNPYQWKVFTLLYSTFSEILFLDADSMPIINPDFIFDSDIYKENGVLLWPDYWKHTGHPLLPYLVGLSSEKSSDMLVKEMSIESGQIYWNKETHWKSLVLATYYNYHGVDFWYTIFNNGWAGWGDKDSFAMACKAAQQPYYQVPHTIVTVFVTGTLLGIGMVQADPSNKTAHSPLFMHSNMVKWSMRDFLCEKCKPLPGVEDRISHLNNEKSPIISHLKEGKRIFATEQLFKGGVDPEPLMWKALEHTACRSVWGNEEVCQNARNHMEKTFGYQFTKNGKPNKDFGGGICIEGPFPKDSETKNESKSQ